MSKKFYVVRAKKERLIKKEAPSIYEKNARADKKEWLVKRKGVILSYHTTQKYAIASAIERATPIGAEIVVHGEKPKGGMIYGYRGSNR